MEKIELVDGVKFVLGKRQLGAWRFAGLVPVIIALVFVGVAAGIVIPLLASGGSPVMLIFLAVFFALFLLPAVGGAWVAMLTAFGHTQVTVSGGYLTRIQCLGPLRRRKRVKLADITQIEVGMEPVKLRDKHGRHIKNLDLSQLPGLPDDVSALTVRKLGRKAMTIGLGYREPELRELAAQISAHAQLQSGPGDEATGIQVADAATPDAERRPDDAIKPTASKIEVTEHETGVTFRLPAMGVWKGSKGLFPFGLIFAGIAGAVGSGFFYAWLFTPDGPEGWAQLFLLIPVAMFAFGVAITVQGLNMGRRQAVVDVVGDALLVTQEGLFGIKQREWKREQITDVVVAPSGTEVNDRPVMHLEIRLRQGKPAGMFAERYDAELDWLAAELRRRLNVVDHPDDLAVERS